MAVSRHPGCRPPAPRIRGALASLCRRFASDQHGTTAIEYGIVAVGIAVAVIATVAAIGTQLNESYFKPVQAMFGQ